MGLELLEEVGEGGVQSSRVQLFLRHTGWSGQE